MDVPSPKNRLRKRLLILVTAGVPILFVVVIFYPVYAEWSREREVIDLLETKQIHYKTDSGLEIWKTLGTFCTTRLETGRRSVQLESGKHAQGLSLPESS